MFPMHGGGGGSRTNVACTPTSGQSLKNLVIRHILKHFARLLLIFSLSARSSFARCSVPSFSDIDLNIKVN